jgi:hypothetical protein
VLALRAPATLIRAAQLAAECEGLSKSDIARHALMDDLAHQQRELAV